MRDEGKEGNEGRKIGRAAVLGLWCALIAACAAPEDAARVELRERLKESRQLTGDELGRLRAEVNRAIAGKRFRIQEGDATRTFDDEQRRLVFGMLDEPVGMFDEGLVTDEGAAFRVLNSPGESANPEIEASRRLWIEVESLLPRRFEFTYAFPAPGDYAFELVAEP
jgi:hypothetical protein